MTDQENALRVLANTPKNLSGALSPENAQRKMSVSKKGEIFHRLSDDFLLVFDCFSADLGLF